MNKACDIKYFGDQLQAVVKANPDSTALTDENGNTTTYSALLSNIEQISNQLKVAGLAPEDVVAVVMPNGPKMAQTVIGCMAYCVCAPLMPEFTDKEFEHYLTTLRAKIILTEYSPDHAIQQVGRKLGIPVATLIQIEGQVSLSLLSQPLPDYKSQRLPPETALLLFSSGTTAKPKLIPLTRRNISWTSQTISAHLELTPVDSTLSVMPLFHVHGLIGSLLSTLVSGGNVICLSRFEQECFLDFMNQGKVTWYSAVPTIHDAVLEAIKQYPDCMHNHQLRFIRSSSSPLPPDMMKAMEFELGIPVIEAYGMTECCHQLASNQLPPGRQKPGSVGKATGSDIFILDDEAQVIHQSGIVGQIAVSGNGTTPGYLNASESGFLNQRLITGDLGYFDDDGFLFITGRAKEIINRGGEKISPAEIDQHLLKHRDVSAAACFGIPHKTLGELLLTAVVRRPNTSVTEAEIKQFMQTRLAPHKVPDQIVFVDELPKTVTGKPQRNKLRERFTENPSIDEKNGTDSIEQIILSTWTAILSTDKIGINQNFFALGGDSLKATRVVSALQEAFSVELEPTLLFSTPTIREMANWLRENRIADTSLTIASNSNNPEICKEHTDNPSAERTRLLI